jgi:hypothetical protein
MLKKNEPDWIEHDGSSECPVPAGHDVEVEYSWGKTYRCDNPELRNWPRITHYRDWTAFEQQQASAGEVPAWAWERAEELAGCTKLFRDEPANRAFARYIAAHEPKGEVPKLLTEAGLRKMLKEECGVAGWQQDRIVRGFKDRILLAPEPEPDALRDLAEELARESQDLNLPLRKRVDWFEAQLRERGVTAPWYIRRAVESEAKTLESAAAMIRAIDPNQFAGETP